jgi:hypothetical protein
MRGISARTKVFAAVGKNPWPSLVVITVLTGTALQLHHQGRAWWCSCGREFLWTSNAWGSQTSQLFFDPYSLTHLLHGLAFGGLLALTVREMPTRWRLCLAIAMEGVWEIVENTDFVIQRYREATASLGYQGDTVANSLGDIMCCGVGFMIARRLGWLRSLAVFFATEALLLIWIRDSLVLEVVMLLHPIGAIRAWQIGG